ncbi:MAG: hypothetical protein R6V23_15155 [Bacteroidales bacterium]
MKRRSKIINIVVVLFFILLLIYRNNKIETRKEILEKGKVTYGKVTQLRKTGWYSSRGTNYFYYINGKKYYEPFGNFPSDSLKKMIREGAYYEVIYLPDNPEKSLMLFDKPINDTLDFINE